MASGLQRGKDIAVFDLYRIADGKIVDHWMNEEEIGPREILTQA